MGILDNKVIILTGAGGGIGRESARVLAEAGAKLVLADISEQTVKETVEIVRADGFDAEPVIVDVSDEESVKEMVARAVSVFGRLDGAFNNAAVEQQSKMLVDLSLAEWERAMRVDLTGVFLCLKYQIPAMLANGGGSIVNTSSASAHVAFPAGAEYVSAKAGILGLTRAAALDYGSQGVRVNAVLPGLIRTPMVERLGEDPAFQGFLERSRERHVLKRFGEPAEIGQVAKWLLSDESTFVHGAEIFADGGISVNGGA